MMEAFEFYRKCIFCGEDLSDESKRFEEHIIPQNIFGFWKSKDICQKCGKHFGDNVDNLALKNPLIIEALKELNLSNKTIDDRLLNYYGIDKSSGGKIEMIKKGDRYFVKSQNNIIDEAAIVPYLKRLYANSGIEKDVLGKEIERICREQQQINLGDITESELLNSSFKKGTVHGVNIENAKEAITPLIAKIATFAIYYFINPMQICNITNVDLLIKRAFLEENSQPKIIREMGPREKCYKPYHYTYIEIINNSNAIVIHIGLFYFLWWAVILNTEKAIKVQYDNQLLKKIGLKFNFSNPACRVFIPILASDTIQTI